MVLVKQVVLIDASRRCIRNGADARYIDLRQLHYDVLGFFKACTAELYEISKIIFRKIRD